MFWEKKQMTTTIDKEVIAAKDIKLSAAKSKDPLQQKAKTPKMEKLSGPRSISGLVEKHLMSKYNMDADLIRILKMVVRKRPQDSSIFDYRVFDQAEADAKEMQVKDYTTLDKHDDLVLYEGWFDDDNKHIEMTEKRTISLEFPLLTEAEIQRKIDALSEPGSTVFFYMAQGAARGGPLGMGAAIIELNPDKSKKAKKYNIYTANVIGMEPVANKQKLFKSNKSKEIAHWVKEAHHKRMY
jgi:hypothetical protein